MLQVLVYIANCSPLQDLIFVGMLLILRKFKLVEFEFYVPKWLEASDLKGEMERL
jgi:hypothetical protein